MCVPGGIISSKIGRCKIIIFSVPFVLAGWLLISFAATKIMLFSGRILTCLFVSLYFTSTGVYISETVHPDIRGSLVILSPFFMASGNYNYLPTYKIVAMFFVDMNSILFAGVFLDWIIGYFSSWRIAAACGAANCAILIITMIFLPETPYWLVENNQIEAAKNSLIFFRGTDYDVDSELNEIKVWIMCK